jgi:general secretion pathway protein K
LAFANAGGDEVNANKKFRQRGAAILMAMLVVTLVATLAAGLQWRQWRMLQQEAAARAQNQAGWVLVGALDWARLILREDVRSAGNIGIIDHLGEPWALPLQEAKLGSFLTADSLSDPAQDAAYLSGYMVDAQSKINLTNLISNQTGTAVVSTATSQSLTRLYQQLNLPAAELKSWLARWQTSSNSANGVPLEGNPDVALRPMRIDQLTWLGVPSGSVEVLKKYLTILPVRTPVNLNTASAEVIFATIPQIDFAAAQKLVNMRAQSPLQKLSDASNVMRLGTNLLETDFSVYSQYFEVRGRLRLGDWQVIEESLVQRDSVNVTAVWRRRM